MFKNILFPIELTREARKAIELTANMVRIHQSKLTILSVVEEDAEGAMASEEQVAKLLEKAKNFFAGQGIQAATLEKVGIPAFTICDVADEIDADLIIMGCRGLGLIDEEAAMDSATNRVINLANCPVLVVS
ncbi:universal stress protein [Waterburya agarophytonicola K14]|uniref:Universal stress protein n=1 Tax=Waterburya agarophytonicola KI4 TaxID=2874699 RepID=A0A964BS55_9CYAN|nr:universal stress protein [Waterburya agarophytonicola]MCC0177533.1 universal stress protein [Waterburya agarophytonicola KI4]